MVVRCPGEAEIGEGGPGIENVRKTVKKSQREADCELQYCR